MPWEDFIDECIAYARRHPEQRFGQACMNCARLVYGSPAMRVTPDIWEVDNPQDERVLHWFEALATTFGV